jgi:hypothetical protein
METFCQGDVSDGDILYVRPYIRQVYSSVAPILPFVDIILYFLLM